MVEQKPKTAPAGRVCPDCGKSFESTHHSKKFCNEKCKQAFANREAARGKAMASFAMAWRLGRAGGGRPTKQVAKDAFTELCRMLDEFNAEDRAAGRPPITNYVSGMVATGYTYQDRRLWNAKAPWRQKEKGVEP